MVYIPLPNRAARLKILHMYLDGQDSSIDASTIEKIADATDGYSAADLQIVCRETLMIPVRTALRSEYFREVLVSQPGSHTPKRMWTPCSQRAAGARKVCCTSFLLREASCMTLHVSDEYATN